MLDQIADSRSSSSVGEDQGVVVQFVSADMNQGTIAQYSSRSRTTAATASASSDSASDAEVQYGGGVMRGRITGGLQSDADSESRRVWNQRPSLFK